MKVVVMRIHLSKGGWVVIDRLDCSLFKAVTRVSPSLISTPKCLAYLYFVCAAGSPLLDTSYLFDVTTSELILTSIQLTVMVLNSSTCLRAVMKYV